MDTVSRVTVIRSLYLTVGTFTTNDSLVLYSDSTATARIAPIASGAGISGNTTVMQYIPGGRRAYRFWAHPFSNYIPLSQLQRGIDITGALGAINGFTTTGSNAASAFRYDPFVANSAAGSDPGWRAFGNTFGTPDTNKFKRYQGIRLFIRGAKGQGLGFDTYTPSPTTITTAGNLNQGKQMVHLSKGGAANQDYNMVGNPYASPVDIGTIIGNAKAQGNIAGSAFYVWNPYLGTSGNFQTITINPLAPVPYYIQANTAFQVRAAHNGDTLVFQESNKNATASTVLLKQADGNIALTLYDNQYHAWDQVQIGNHADATDEEDNDLDATKPFGTDCNFYTQTPAGTPMAIDTRNLSQASTIALGMTCNYEQEYIIKATNITLNRNATYYLHDKHTGSYEQLQEGSEYRFVYKKQDSAINAAGRFEITSSPAQSIGNVFNVNLMPNPATTNVNIQIENTISASTAINIYNLSGEKVYSTQANNSNVSVSLSNFATGIYMVEAISGGSKTVKKLIKE
ncbi:MAG: T9SS C-terminal target domain-containing protein [Chitinophagia bacterium]|nr:T9SS C-terminal target domain-containing protein [Chitinophagia bacterium]